jgi:hypothetical protein
MACITAAVPIAAGKLVQDVKPGACTRAVVTIRGG